MPSSTATPMLDKVRQHAKDWGIKIIGDRTRMVGDLSLRPDSYQKFLWTHDGPGIFGIHWPTRRIVEPIATPNVRPIACENDAWYLIHEISHVLLSVDPEQVDEARSAMLALDYYAGLHLGLGAGWEKWMSGFTLDRETLLDNGVTKLEADLLLVEWGDFDQATEEILLSKSLKMAVDAGLLTAQGVPTFDHSAWMPVSMRAEQIAMPLATALAAMIAEARR